MDDAGFQAEHCFTSAPAHYLAHLNQQQWLIAAVPYRIHTVLTDSGIQFTTPGAGGSAVPLIKEAIANGELFRAHALEYACAKADIEHRTTKPKHPWTNGQVERMNRTIKEATVKRFYYESHDQLRQHLADFVAAYNFARRLKTLKGLTPYEFICKCWATEPERFSFNPHHQMPGLNTGIIPGNGGLPSPDFVILNAAKKRGEKLKAKGKPFDFAELLKMEPNGGTTNIRKTELPHWQQWLGVENRCVVPFTSFAEPQKIPGQEFGGPPVWFALDESRPLAFFAGAWTNWTGVRKIKEGVVTADLYAFLTTGPNPEVFEIHEKAMPVILRTKEEVDTWLNAPWSEAKSLQRPLPAGSLTIVARGTKTDGSDD